MRMGRGALVRLRENKLLMAKVRHTIRGIRGGRRLDRPLAGFTDWNIEELEPVPKHSPLRRFFDEKGGRHA